MPRYGLYSHHTDNLCLARGPGIRVGYGSLRLLGAHTTARLINRVILVVTANRHYALDGVHPGAQLATARARLRLTAPIWLGHNEWYTVHGGSVTGLLKVRHGTVAEVGIVDRGLTRARVGERRLLLSF
jgi:hypothetical protein